MVFQVADLHSDVTVCKMLVMRHQGRWGHSLGKGWVGGWTGWDI